MSELLRKVDETLNLRLSLSDSEENKFVRAYITDQGGDPIDELDLSHLANGVYGENAFLMPDLRQIDVKYKVFRDSGFSIEDPIYPNAFDIVRKQPDAEEVNVDVTVLENPKTDLIGTVQDSEDVAGSIQESDTASGTVEEAADESGSLDGETAISGEVEDSELSASTSGEDDLEGSIET